MAVDDDLVLARRRAHEAFERVVVPELDVLYRSACSITGNRTDAEDLVQDTLIRALRAIDRFDGRHPRAWLLTIMRNAQRNRVRRRRPGLLADPDTPPDVAATGPAPDDAATGSEFDAVVAAAFAELPAKFHVVVQLVDVDGLRYQEAADLLGVPIGTVMSRLHRARARLRDRVVAAGLAPKGRRP